MFCIRTLVVEDFEAWRRFISALLRREPQLHIICEVSDGLEAVKKAQELKPDLILLDMGLPNLDGIAASRRIRTVSPQSKILFFSQESTAAVVREALGVGAGFVIKADARELLSAVKAVMSGEQFLSSRAKVRTPEGAVAELAQEGLQ